MDLTNNISWNSDEYWSAQDFQTSARLHLQHWIWNYQLGYALHPSIDIKASRRIADVACGNGAWILEVARNASLDHTTFDGFDVTASNFPAAHWLPENIHLHTWNAYGSVPDEYVGVFDVVHLRAMFSTVIDNNVGPLLSNALKMLKPGGHLQWDEMDASTLTCYLPSSGVEGEAMQTLVKLLNMFSEVQSKLLPGWLYGFPSTLRDRGCVVVAEEKFEPRKELVRAWTDNMLLVWKDLPQILPEQDMPLPPGVGLPESISRRSFTALVVKAVQESSQGAMLGITCHVFVAKKG